MYLKLENKHIIVEYYKSMKMICNYTNMDESHIISGRSQIPDDAYFMIPLKKLNTTNLVEGTEQ